VIMTWVGLFLLICLMAWMHGTVEWLVYVTGMRYIVNNVMCVWSNLLVLRSHVYIYVGRKACGRSSFLTLSS
jgi:hypothetical protein